MRGQRPRRPRGPGNALADARVGRPPPDAFVLGAFFASFVLAARGATRGWVGVAGPVGGLGGALRRRLALAASCFCAGTVGATLPLVVAFLD